MAADDVGALSDKFPVAVPATSEETALKLARCEARERIGPGVSPELLPGSGTGASRAVGNNSWLFRTKMKSSVGSPERVTSIRAVWPTVSPERLVGDDSVR